MERANYKDFYALTLCHRLFTDYKNYICSNFLKEEREFCEECLGYLEKSLFSSLSSIRLKKYSEELENYTELLAPDSKIKSLASNFYYSLYSYCQAKLSIQEYNEKYIDDIESMTRNTLYLHINEVFAGIVIGYINKFKTEQFKEVYSLMYLNAGSFLAKIEEKHLLLVEEKNIQAALLSEITTMKQITPWIYTNIKSKYISDENSLTKGLLNVKSKLVEKSIINNFKKFLKGLKTDFFRDKPGILDL
ncbi:MAG: hypothetical protein AAGJ18_19885 [Bacteroidota bacterium]